MPRRRCMVKSPIPRRPSQRWSVTRTSTSPGCGRFAQTRRKALRTFATAVRQRELDERFCFAQSQPQLYAWVQAADPDLFARVAEQVGRGWDARWRRCGSNPICTRSPASRFCDSSRSACAGWKKNSAFHRRRVAARHVRVSIDVAAARRSRRDARVCDRQTRWNETTRWPYPQFRWFGDDGSSVVAAVLDRYDGDGDNARVTIARDRREPWCAGTATAAAA